jgi:hypothetical protein
MPSFNACWRSAPGVRFINLDIFATGVFAFECLRNSECNPFVQLLRLVRLAFLAMHHLFVTRRFYNRDVNGMQEALRLQEEPCSLFL